MAINKVIKKGVVELDLTSDTVTPETLMSGVTAHNAAGEAIEGTIASGSAKTPATTITKNPTISVNSSGLITASVSGTQSVTPTVTSGYVSSGTAGTITVSGSATKQLTTQAAQTITPGTSDKMIASGRYLTGTQTIKGDANLVAGNIKSGVSIFGVSGSYEGSGGSVGTCTVTMNLPPYISVAGYGTYDFYYAGTKIDSFTMPSTTDTNSVSFDHVRIFNNIPVGSVFTFCGRGKNSSTKITGISATNNIETSFIEMDDVINDYHYFAVCRCNGDGEITIVT